MASISYKLILRPSLWSEAYKIAARFDPTNPAAVQAAVADPAAFQVKAKQAIADLKALVGSKSFFTII